MRNYLPALLLLSACTVGPDYHAPNVSAPEQWNSALPTKPNATASQHWWESLGDPTLNSLETQALAANEDRQIAIARVQETRGARLSAQGGLFPHMEAISRASKNHDGFLTGGGDLTMYHAGFDASYELDLFGGQRRAVEAQDALVGASTAEYQNVSLTLTAEVASEYVTYRELQHQRELAEETAKAESHIADIASNRFKSGLIDSMERDQSQALALSSAAQVTEYERQLAATANRISVMLGQNPGKIAGQLGTAKPLPQANLAPALDAPAELLRRRPDVARAERELAAATALQGVAISKLYPNISLSALFGLQYSRVPLAGFSNSDSNWLLGGNIAMPLLEFGTIEGQINSAEAKQQQAYHRYRKTVLAALSDVETALSNLSNQEKRVQQLASATSASKHAVATARDSYQRGLSNFVKVLQAEQQSYQLEQSYETSKAERLQYLIALHKAIAPEMDAPPSATAAASEGTFEIIQNLFH